MINTLTLVTEGIGIVATAFCGWKAHNAGKVIPDAVKLIEDLTADKQPDNEGIGSESTTAASDK